LYLFLDHLLLFPTVK